MSSKVSIRILVLSIILSSFLFFSNISHAEEEIQASESTFVTDDVVVEPSTEQSIQPTTEEDMSSESPNDSENTSVQTADSNNESTEAIADTASEIQYENAAPQSSLSEDGIETVEPTQLAEQPEQPEQITKQDVSISQPAEEDTWSVSEDNTSVAETSKPEYVYNEDTKIPVLMYHLIDNNPENYEPSLVVTPDEMQEHLEYFDNAGYTSIKLKDLYSYIATDEYALPEKPIIYTFDDGYESNYQHLYPLLQQYNANATVFTVPDAVGTQNFITWDEAREMESSGLVEIYNHSKNHDDLGQLSANDVAENVLSAEIAIENQLGSREIRAMAYPYGSFTETSIDVLQNNLDFNMQVSTIPGVNNKYSDLNRIKRMGVTHGQTGSILDYYISLEL